MEQAAIQQGRREFELEAMTVCGMVSEKLMHAGAEDYDFSDPQVRKLLVIRCLTEITDAFGTTEFQQQVDAHRVNIDRLTQFIDQQEL